MNEEVATFKVGSTTVVSARNLYFAHKGNVLVNLEGFRDSANVSIETQQKLIGKGSYVVKRDVGERIVEVELKVTENRETVGASFIAAAESGGLITIELAYYSSTGSLIKKETISNGLINSNVRYNDNGINADITFSVLFANPNKTLV